MNKKLLFCLVGTGLILPLMSGCGEEKKEEEVVETTHVFNYKDLSTDFLLNGLTEYKIVTPKVVTAEIKYAVDDLTRFINEASGATITSITDEGLTHNANQKFISLGKTELFKSITVPEIKYDLGRDGSRIITKDNNVYIFGETDIAVLYGTYNFLNINFNFEQYSNDCYTLTTGVKNLKLKDYNVFDIPDIAYRERKGVANSTTAETDDVMFAYRLRTLDGYGKMLLPIHLTDSKTSEWKVDHNSFFYFPLDVYKESHPEFYSSDFQQLCFTGKGKEGTFKLMTEIAAQKVEKSLEMYPYADYPNYVGVQFGIQDNWNMCKCDACTKCKAEHNDSYSAHLIIFLKAMGKLVNEWMAKEENAAYRRDLTYMFLAYQSTEIPPFKTVDNIPEDVKTVSEEAKIAPYCAFAGFDYGKSFYHENNNADRKYIEQWGTVYPGSWAWSYGGFFHDYLAFYDDFSFYSDYHAYLKKYNFVFSFEQERDSQRGANSGFGNLVCYALAKKAWNSSLNMNDLIDNYLKAEYGDAYPKMKEIFEAERLWFLKSQAAENWGESSNNMTPTTTKRLFSSAWTKQMTALYDEALTIIDKYSDNPDLYIKYKHRIEQEWVFIGKVIVDNFSKEYTSEEYSATKKRLKECITNVGIQYIIEFVSINSYLETL